ncbi:DMT family transporter [Streptomyces sp. NPDC002265]|uniref:DMT family transporter n=1 Tax=Streptomyces sp. NPDC002265 TaxID=3154415 RepID=UPI0033188D31
MSEARRTDAVLLLVALVWGSSYLSAQTAVSALPVLTVLFARYALSSVACLGVMGAGRRGPRRWTRDEVRAGVPLGLTQAMVLVVETYGVAHTSAANAGLIISLAIVLTPLLDRSGHPGGLPPAFYAAAGVCVLAVGLLMSDNGFQAPRLGDLLMLAAAGLRAVHVALVGRFTARRAVRPLQLTTLQTLVGTALFLPAAAVTGLSGLVRADGATWTQLLYLALFCSVFAFLAQTWAVQRTSASRASLLLGTEPVWAALVGVVLGGEHLGPLTGLGAALMVAGTYWGQSVERAHRAPTPAPDRESGPDPAPLRVPGHGPDPVPAHDAQARAQEDPSCRTTTATTPTTV